MIDYKALLESAQTVEALPLTVSRLGRIIGDPDHDVSEIVDAVALDQALTAIVLRQANSVAMMARRPVTSVHEAAVRLGSSAILSTALAVSVAGRMGGALPGYGLDEGELWRQSVAASVAAEVVRSRAWVDVPPEAATAALLHDFGKVVIAQHVGPQLLGLMKLAARGNDFDLVTAERQIFGMTHADVGGLIAQQWKLPFTIVDAIIHHHETGDEHTAVSAAVSLAHAMVPDILGMPAPELELVDLDRGDADLPGGGLPAPEPVPVTHLLVMGTLGVPPMAYDEMVAEAQARYATVADQYAA